MKTIIRFFKNYINSFRKAGLVGKIILGGIAFMCLCGLPITFIKPSASSPTQESVSIDISSIQTAAVDTLVAGINQTAAANAPTNTTEPTDTITPSITDAPAFTPTITNTPPPPLPVGVSSCIPQDTLRETALVLGIVDGDTINVQLNGIILPVRYIGVDAPETGREYYGQAAQINQNLVYSKTVTLITDVSDKDSNGNLLRYVLIDNVFVNLEIVKQGYARSVSVSPNIACSTTFTNAQSQAQTTGVGVWIPTPAPPVSTGGGSGGGFDNNGDGKVTCDDFTTQAQAYAALQAGYTNLDGDGDGEPCESL